MSTTAAANPPPAADATVAQRIVDGLHGAGIHIDGQALQDATAQVGQQIEQVGQALGGMDMSHLLALAAALGWASGLRLYAVVFVLGLAGAMDWLALPGALGVLQSPVVLFFSGILLFMEFFADKIPGLDSLWDVLQSVVRVPAGAALAAAVFGADNASMAMMAALMGGTLAATSQAAKTTSRAAINTSPEPFSNLGASLAEDGLSLGAVWLALVDPFTFTIVLVMAVLLMWAMTWLLWRFLRAAWQRLRGWLGRAEPAAQSVPALPVRKD